MFLGAYVEKQVGRPLHVWDGECHVHAGIRPRDELARRPEGRRSLPRLRRHRLALVRPGRVGDRGPDRLTGRDHLMYRGYYQPVKGVIDGDLCERFMALSYDGKARIAAELEREPKEVEKKVVEMRTRVAF